MSVIDICYITCTKKKNYPINISSRKYIFLFLVCDARKVRASGRGLQQNGVRVKDEADFKVYTEGAGEGNVEVRVIGPGK